MRYCGVAVLVFFIDGIKDETRNVFLWFSDILRLGRGWEVCNLKISRVGVILRLYTVYTKRVILSLNLGLISNTLVTAFLNFLSSKYQSFKKIIPSYSYFFHKSDLKIS